MFSIHCADRAAPPPSSTGPVIWHSSEMTTISRSSTTSSTRDDQGAERQAAWEGGRAKAEEGGKVTARTVLSRGRFLDHENWGETMIYVGSR